ncbi:hypothetical protein Glove_353g18 [Diversispora epigaea]|uniref:Uncharacterized protein n=1 Tax=Diversispora epigaea TaxID=1348612 RepID=A0A397HBS0_9GLOM|nr:hypothetical protein Glove_353g18 [Diversispora epigaea]
MCIKQKSPTIEITNNNNITPYTFLQSYHHEPETYLGRIIAYIMNDGMEYINDLINRYVYVDRNFTKTSITNTPSEGSGVSDSDGDEEQRRRRKHNHDSENSEPASETDSAKTTRSDQSEQSESDSEMVDHSKKENIPQIKPDENLNTLNVVGDQSDYDSTDKFNENTRFKESDKGDDTKDFKTEKKDEESSPPKIIPKSNENDNEIVTKVVPTPTIEQGATLKKSISESSTLNDSNEPNSSDTETVVTNDQEENYPKEPTEINEEEERSSSKIFGENIENGSYSGDETKENEISEVD